MNNMDRIKINCDECEFVNNLDGMLIDFNYDYVKNIIDSNYITYINYCDHNKNALQSLFVKIYNSKSLILNLNLLCVTNKKYLQIHNKFTFRKAGNILKILSNKHSIKDEINVEEFINTIKKGTVIRFEDYNLVKILEEILVEHNTDFIIKKLQGSKCNICIIDSPNYTKPALSLQLDK